MEASGVSGIIDANMQASEKGTNKGNTSQRETRLAAGPECDTSAGSAAMPRRTGMNIFLTALGCKLNYAEMEAVARRIESMGHRAVPTAQQAEWAIVNTCAVTHVAARKSRQLIRRLARARPDLRIAVTGCYADLAPGDVRAIHGVCLVVSNRDKDAILERIPGLVPQRCGEAARVVVAGGPSAVPPPGRSPLGRTRAFVKIQDGCDNHCAYCVVTLARGPQRSRAPKHILSEIRDRVAEGHQEIVLTGVHIGAYGHDGTANGSLPPSEGWSLARLVRTILQNTDVCRLRVSSIEPWDLTPELLSLWPHPRLCRHLHLPLQSGCDDTLRRMGRKYDTRGFERLVNEIRGRIPHSSITTDVMVGFPAESEAEFATTLRFVEKMRFARLHVFRYSLRAGTLAARMPNQVHPRTAQVRSEKLIALGRRMSADFCRQFVDAELEVLFESARSDSTPTWTGLTDNYVRVSVPATRSLANVLATVRCISADETGLRGELV